MLLSNKELILLDYHPFLYESYQQLSHLPGFVLLESTDHIRGRYDILSAYPYDRITIKENTLLEFDLLNYLKKRLPLCKSELDLPFQGGAIGYISYDLGAHLLGIHAKAQPSLRDVPLLDLGLYDWAIIVDHYLKKITLFLANNHSTTADIKQEIIRLWYERTSKNQRFLAKSAFTPLITKESYQVSFNAIHQALKAGRSYQVNFTQPFHAEYEGDAWEMYKKISTQNPVPFAAFLRINEADILSFSPERFIFYDNGRLLTSPIKGTIARSKNLLEDEQLKNQLASCTKNRAENVMIVDLLRNDFGKISYPGTVNVSNLCHIQSYNSLHHLVSDIEAQCFDNLHPLDAFISCFPGGSITGAPKLESMKIINEQEDYARGI